MLSVKTVKFIGTEQSKLSKKWLLKFELCRDGIMSGIMRTAPQFNSEQEAVSEGHIIEENYNRTGVFPNLFKMF